MNKSSDYKITNLDNLYFEIEQADNNSCLTIIVHVKTVKTVEFQLVKII